MLDVPAVLKALKEVKFKGTISIEYEANPNDPSPDVKKCVAYVKETGQETRLSADRIPVCILFYDRGTRTPAAQPAGVFVFCSPGLRDEVRPPMTPEEIAELRAASATTAPSCP